MQGWVHCADSQMRKAVMFSPAGLKKRSVSKTSRPISEVRFSDVVHWPIQDESNAGSNDAN